MAQRRMDGYRLRRIARRYGVVGARGVASVMAAIACVAGGAGVAWQLHEGGTVIERRAATADAGDVNGSDDAMDPASLPVQGDAGEGQEAPRRYVVHVDGAVAAPGVVCLEGDDLRVFDAVEEAGGLLDDAETSTVNLAEPLADGAKIHIPHEGEEPVAAGVGAAEQPGQTSTVGATGAGGGQALVNLNTATEAELQTLTGIGEVTARTIVEDRERNGPFASAEDLMRVSGIGEKKFEKVRDRVCV